MAEDALVGDRDSRSEGRVGHHDVGKSERRRSARRFDAGQVAVRELQGVEVVQVALAVAGHHHVHLARPDQERVEVAAEDLRPRVASQPLVQRLELLRGIGLGADVLFRAEPVHAVRERRHQEAAGSTRRIEQPFIFLRVENLNDEPNGAARREVLAPVAAKVRADDLLIGGALRVYVDAGELVLRELRDHEREGAVGQTDLFAAAEDGLVLVLHLAEERLDALSHRLAAVGRELLLRAGPEAAAVAARPLVVHLAEDEVEELPERRVLRHALVAVDEVVAAAKRSAQHLRVGASSARPRQHVAVADGLVSGRPVADRLGIHLELGSLLSQEEELQPVGPQGVPTGVDLLEERLDLGDVLRGLFVVAHLHGPALVLLRLGAAHYHSVDIVELVRLARAEDCDVDPAPPAADRDGEVRPHVVDRDRVLVEQRPGDPLPDQLLRRLLDLLVPGNEVEDEPVADDIDRSLGVRRSNRCRPGGRTSPYSPPARSRRRPCAHASPCAPDGAKSPLPCGLGGRLAGLPIVHERA